MAAEGEMEREVRVHRISYAGFIALMKWGAILSVLTAFLVIILISD